MSRLIFLDTTNISEIKKWENRGICDGITTNQKIFSQQKNINFKKTVLDICKASKVCVSVELTTHDSVEAMVKEAKKYKSWHKSIVVKVPMTLDGSGLDVLYKLKNLKIRTNATLMMSFEQMMLAIKTGADYASIFFNRAKDSGYNPEEIIRRSRDFIDFGGYKSQIITGSIRNIRDVGDAFASGSDIVTIPPPILEQMLQEEMTRKTIDEFDKAWKDYAKK